MGFFLPHPTIRILSLVTDTDKVVGEGLDGLGGAASNLGLAVVGDDDGLAGLGDGDTLATLSGVDASVLGSGHDISLATDVEAIGKGLVLGCGIARDDGGYHLHLGGLELHWAQEVSSGAGAVRQISQLRRAVGTERPGEVAQTLSPAALMRAAWSTWPVAMRLSEHQHPALVRKISAVSVWLRRARGFT